MHTELHKKYSSNVCAKCGGPAPHWKCPGCGVSTGAFDPRHKFSCRAGMKLEPRCEGCNEAESKCVCGKIKN